MAPEVPAYMYTWSIRGIILPWAPGWGGAGEKGLAVGLVLSELKSSMFLVFYHRQSDLTIQSETLGLSPVFCYASFGTAQGGWQHAWCRGEDHLPLGLKLVDIHTTWKQGLALKKQPTLLLDTGKACQCKAITTAEGHLGTNLAQQPCCHWLRHTNAFGDWSLYDHLWHVSFQVPRFLIYSA